MTEPSPEHGVSIAPGVWLPESALRFTFSRSGGPGGQNVNKLSTKATLTVRVVDLAEALPVWALQRLLIHAGGRFAGDGDEDHSGGRIIITDSTSRSQHANKQACLSKLRMMVIEAMNRPKRRRPTKPSRASIQRRLDAKRHRARRLAERRKPSDP